MALDQIAVARTIVLTAFAISFGAVMLGLAIAFGIGGRQRGAALPGAAVPVKARGAEARGVSHL